MCIILLIGCLLVAVFTSIDNYITNKANRSLKDDVDYWRNSKYLVEKSLSECQKLMYDEKFSQNCKKFCEEYATSTKE